ncbi:MAG: type II and III secretion system protein, partial [Rhodocyclaceae bacterium]
MRGHRVQLFLMRVRAFAAGLVAAALTACATGPFPVARNAHIRADSAPPAAASGSIPQPVRQAIILPPPKPSARTETYSVVVNNVRAQDLLFALARDAKLNVDVHPGIAGTVTLNAIDQTLPQLLNRISKQVDMRYELDG